MDPYSNSTRYFNSTAEFEAAASFVESFQPLLKPTPLWSFYENTFHVSDFAGVFVPGGHSPLIDLMG